jgi:hypothetical protein
VVVDETEKKTNETTRRSGCGTVFKKSLKGPTLLEMDGKHGADCERKKQNYTARRLPGPAVAD